MTTKDYDVVVIGSGSANHVARFATGEGYRVGMVDMEPVGGTCLNLGCVPSKMLIAAADHIVAVSKAAEVGVRLRCEGVDFRGLLERVNESIAEKRRNVMQGIKENERLDYYRGRGHFLDDHTVAVGDGGQRVRGERIFVACGARPLIPPISGVDEVDYLTNESLLDLREPPESLIIVGGGYVGCEYAHFFSAVGVDVTVLEMDQRLVAMEEPEVSELLATSLAERMTVGTGQRVTAMRQVDGGCEVDTVDSDTGDERTYGAQRVMLAIGRRPNTDTLDVDKAGIALDERGYIQVNNYLRTTVPHIWAIGDCNGKQMFTHVANREARVAWHNATHPDEPVVMEYDATPHAVFSHPNIASVGLTEADARQDFDILVATVPYMDVIKGQAIMAEGFVKAIVDRESREILGYHVIGPEAPILIQEVVNAMAQGGGMGQIYAGIHTFPTLPELTIAVLNKIQEKEKEMAGKQQ